ncbi:Membrane protein involved in the export of O-antigen and teichoic acid [Chryseobacterium wanjuense]|uniref:Membrane protein involved in the export of O-antigen and teichoic acid n=1 Tax=Chryseobacterium wanjuense TaxID=356305 RepID=A0A1I0N098_9FLAO|nr:oligosaccharide flippase family protein [Chryseobacterium wanjuense]SEV94339.1 Membrane protein involved in the export of O-antigen and teichoic acid [Chryseobacterium wanjuense]
MGFKDIINRVKSNLFLQNVAILSSGTIISQLIVIATSPFLSRLYSVEAFGLLSVFSSFAIFFAVLSTGRYELALGLPKENIKASNIFKLILCIGFTVSLLYFVLIFVLKDLIHLQDNTGFLNNKQVYLAPVYIFFGALYSALGYWNQRDKKYTKITLANAIQVIGTSVFSLFFGVINYEGGLILSLILGIIISSLYLLLTDKELLSHLSSFDNKMLKVGKEYKAFPRYMILSDLSLTACQQFIPILFSALYNTTIVGFFSMANRMIRLPNIVITSSVGNVFRNDAIDEIRETGNCIHLYQSTLKKLLIISFPIYLLVFAVSPKLFSLVFGEKWEIAGYFARILSVALFFEFLSAPLNTLFYVFEKQKILMRLQIINALFVFISIFLGYYLDKSYYLSLILYTVVSVLSSLIFLYFTNNLSKNASRKA